LIFAISPKGFATPSPLYQREKARFRLPHDTPSRKSQGLRKSRAAVRKQPQLPAAPIVSRSTRDPLLAASLICPQAALVQKLLACTLKLARQASHPLKGNTQKHPHRLVHLVTEAG